MLQRFKVSSAPKVSFSDVCDKLTESFDPKDKYPNSNVACIQNKFQHDDSNSLPGKYFEKNDDKDTKGNDITETVAENMTDIDAKNCLNDECKETFDDNDNQFEDTDISILPDFAAVLKWVKLYEKENNTNLVIHECTKFDKNNVGHKEPYKRITYHC